MSHEFEIGDLVHIKSLGRLGTVEGVYGDEYRVRFKIDMPNSRTGTTSGWYSGGQLESQHEIELQHMKTETSTEIVMRFLQSRPDDWLSTSDVSRAFPSSDNKAWGRASASLTNLWLKGDVDKRSTRPVLYRLKRKSGE